MLRNFLFRFKNRMKKQLLPFLFLSLGTKYGLGQTSPPAVQFSQTYQPVSWGILPSNLARGYASNGNVFFAGMASTRGLTSSFAESSVLKFDPSRLLWNHQVHSCSANNRDQCNGYTIYDLVPTPDGGALSVGKTLIRVDANSNRMWESALVADGSRAVALTDGTFWVYKSPNQLLRISGNGQQILQSRPIGDNQLLDIAATADGGFVYTGSGGTHKIGGSGGNWSNGLYANNIRQTGDGSFIAWGDNGVLKLAANGAQQGESYYAPGINQLVLTNDNGCAFVTNASVTRLRGDLSSRWVSGSGGGRIAQTTDGDFVVASGSGIRKLSGENGQEKWTLNNPVYTPPQAAPYVYGLAPAGDGGFFQWNSEPKPNDTYNTYLTQIRKFTADPISCTVSASISALGSTSFCTGGSVTLNASTGQNLTYQWRRDGQNIAGANGASYTATQSGSYTVEVRQNATCSALSNAIGVSVAESGGSAFITPLGSTALCAGGSVTLNASTGQNLTYQWRRDGQNIAGANGTSYIATQSGSYTVEVRQGNGCSATSGAVGVSVVEPKVNGISGTTEFCTGSSTTLTASARDGREPYTFRWKRGGQEVSSGGLYTATAGGEYVVEATDAGGCAAVPATVNVRENPKPTANAGPDVFRTGSERYTLSITTATGGTPGYSYAWTTSPAVAVDNASASNPTFGPFTSNTQLTLTVTDSKGCQAEARALVVYTVCSFNARILAKGYFCRGGADTLTLELTGGSGGYTYLWSRNGSPVSDESRYRAFEPGRYTVGVTDQRGCKASAERFVTESPAPSVSIAGVTDYCKGSSASLSATAFGGTTPYTFRWFNGTSLAGTGSGLPLNAPGAYSVTVTDAQGCSGSSSPWSVVEKGADIVALASATGPTQVYTPEKVALTAGGGLGYTFQWLKDGQPIAGATSASYQASTSGTYAVAVSRDGCSVTSAGIRVDVLIPTALPLAVEDGLRFGPNPITSELLIELTLKEAALGRVTLHDLTGQTILSFPESPSANHHQFRANLSLLPGGMYLVSGTFGGYVFQKKIVKMN